jgi:hypothetical protein
MAHIAVCGDEPLQNLITHITKRLDLHCASYDSFDKLKNNLNEVLTAAVTLTDKGMNETLAEIRSLRLNGFRGSILILSFIPRARITRNQGGEILEIQGCYFLQLPVTVSGMVKLLKQQVMLSEEDMYLVRKRLYAHHVGQLASTIKHDYENKFGLALAHLRELEKLSYFSEPNLRQVSREVSHIRISLTRNKVKAWRSDLVSLLSEITKWTGTEQDHDFLNDFVLIENWFYLVDSVNYDAEHILEETFKVAKQAHTAIRRIMASVGAIREAANREIDHVR